MDSQKLSILFCIKVAKMETYRPITFLRKMLNDLGADITIVSKKYQQK